MTSEKNMEEGKANGGERASLVNGQEVPTKAEKPIGICEQVKEKLCEDVYKGIKLWMVPFIIGGIGCILVLISWGFCQVRLPDPDDKFDRASFTVSRYFSGSLRMPQYEFSAELLSLTSNQSLTVSTHLQNKLTQVYTSSPALGRYFELAEIQLFSNDSVVAQYRLIFLMPPTEQEQLKNATLSREVVFNVLRQSLYDLEPEEEGTLYIDPASLEMQVSQGISA